MTRPRTDERLLRLARERSTDGPGTGWLPATESAGAVARPGEPLSRGLRPSCPMRRARWLLHAPIVGRSPPSVEVAANESSTGGGVTTARIPCELQEAVRPQNDRGRQCGNPADAPQLNRPRAGRRERCRRRRRGGRPAYDDVEMTGIAAAHVAYDMLAYRRYPRRWRRAGDRATGSGTAVADRTCPPTGRSSPLGGGSVSAGHRLR
jgi:hypothetical protein